MLLMVFCICFYENPLLMRGFPLQFRFSSVLRSAGFMRRRYCVAMELDDQFPSLQFKTLPRRLALKFIGLNAIVLSVNPVFFCSSSRYERAWNYQNSGLLRLATGEDSRLVYLFLQELQQISLLPRIKVIKNAIQAK
ncbi:uncharacterized protein [Euphorbia lathyris]|uniref:uncharacterized protein isoform X2 n=1 Tax=Euphorbia lathyris TaxID=212925 RepID=UPI003313E428